MIETTSKPKPQAKVHANGKTTKKAQLIKLLGSKAGIDLQALSEKLGWQPHTTRAAMSGLRKAGYAVICVQSAKGGTSKYRIQSTPPLKKQQHAVLHPHAA